MPVMMEGFGHLLSTLIEAIPEFRSKYRHQNIKLNKGTVAGVRELRIMETTYDSHLQAHNYA
eukprot:4157372-Amphidinium_carterae.1